MVVCTIFMGGDKHKGVTRIKNGVHTITSRGKGTSDYVAFLQTRQGPVERKEGADKQERGAKR